MGIRKSFLIFVVALFLAFPMIGVFAKSNVKKKPRNSTQSKENKIERMPEYTFKEEMRLYYNAGNLENGYQYWGSILVPKGMTLKHISWVKPFRDGIRYSEGESEELPSLEQIRKTNVDEERLLYIKPRWGRADVEYVKMSREQLFSEARSAVSGSYTVLRGQEFASQGAVGYWTVRRFCDHPDPEQWWKAIALRSGEFWANIEYFERSTQTGNAVDPAKWNFEFVADQIAKSFRFERLPSSIF